MTLVTVPLLVLVGLGLVMYMGVGPAEEALLTGKMFSAEELKNAETALRKGMLAQYRVEGQRILVPKTEVARYNAALITGNGVPENFAEDFDKVFEKNPFMQSGEGQRRDEMDVAKAKVLVKIIKQIPWIEDAGLVTHRPRQRGFGHDLKMTAMLGVRPRAGHELSSEFAQSLRQTVAGGFGMLSESVTIIDMRTGKSPRNADKTESYNSAYVEAIREITALNEQNIGRALAYIPNVLVSVRVELDTVMHSRVQERKYEAKPFKYKELEEVENSTSQETAPSNEPGVKANQPRNMREPAVAKNTRTTEKTNNSSESVPSGTRVTDQQNVPFAPKSVQVAVAIPKDYYRGVLLKQGVDEGDKPAFQAKMAQLKTETEKEVRDKIAKLIPAPVSGAAADVINVSSFDALETADAPLPVAMTTHIGEAVAQWGGPVGLALFALWALWTLNRSMNRAPDAPTITAGKSAAAGRAAVALAAIPDDNDEQAPKELTKRDKLQTLVKDNPEMAAAVLSRWLSPPK